MSTISCLLQTDYKKLVRDSGKIKGSPSCIWTPVVDGVELADYPHRLLAAGKYHADVPVLLGTNADEGALFVAPPRFPIDGNMKGDQKLWLTLFIRSMANHMLDQTHA